MIVLWFSRQERQDGQDNIAAWWWRRSCPETWPISRFVHTCGSELFSPRPQRQRRAQARDIFIRRSSHSISPSLLPFGTPYDIIAHHGRRYVQGEEVMHQDRIDGTSSISQLRFIGTRVQVFSRRFTRSFLRMSLPARECWLLGRYRFQLNIEESSSLKPSGRISSLRTRLLWSLNVQHSSMAHIENSF